MVPKPHLAEPTDVQPAHSRRLQGLARHRAGTRRRLQPRLPFGIGLERKLRTNSRLVLVLKDTVTNRPFSEATTCDLSGMSQRYTKELVKNQYQTGVEGTPSAANQYQTGVEGAPSVANQYRSGVGVSQVRQEHGKGEKICQKTAIDTESNVSQESTATRRLLGQSEQPPCLCWYALGAIRRSRPHRSRRSA